MLLLSKIIQTIDYNLIQLKIGEVLLKKIKEAVLTESDITNDANISANNIEELSLLCYKIINELAPTIFQTLKQEKKASNLLSDNLDILFELAKSPLNSTSPLKKNILALEDWAQKTKDELDLYKVKDFKNDIIECLEVSFSSDARIMISVIKETKIFETPEQRALALRMMKKFSSYTSEEKQQIDKRISQIIAEMLYKGRDKLNYQWYKKLKGKELKVQKFDEFKQHPLFSPLLK